jgi:hypothetical protein
VRRTKSSAIDNQPKRPMNRPASAPHDLRGSAARLGPDAIGVPPWARHTPPTHRLQTREDGGRMR